MKYTIGLWLFAVLFMGAGAMHFVSTAEYVRIMPPELPWPRMLVYVSGVCEVLGGLGLLYAPVRRWAAWGLVALLVAVFPANIYMLHIGYGAPAWALWLRLPLQGLMIWWAWVYTRADGEIKG
jgi:uncharacterized membrane protein